MSVKLLTLSAWLVFILAALAQPATAPSINKTTLSNGTILLNGMPFPMVLDAGTDSFTPQDYATVMGNKDAWGANTWWLQYSMRHMKSESAGDFSGLSNALDFFEKTGVWVNLYIRGEYRDLPSWFSKTYSDYKMLDPDGKPVGTQVCLQHEGFRRLIDQYARGIARAARNKPSLLMYSTYDEFCERIAHGWLARAEAAMTEAATTPGTPHGDLYGEALQKREFVYAAYNKGDWTETVRLARQNLALCEQLRAACLRGHNEPDPE